MTARTFSPRNGNLGYLIPDDIPGNLTAIVDHRAGGTSWTYGELNAAADAFAALVSARGVMPGDAIAIAADNSAEYFIAYLGGMRAGTIVVPVNIRLPAATIAFILEDSAVRLTVVDAAARGLLPPTMPTLAIEELACRPAPLPFVAPDHPEIAEILYTSGSTGKPKGVQLSHEGQIWAIGMHQLTPLPTGRRTAIVAPMYHMNALFYTAVSLLNGVTIALLPRFEARSYLQTVADFRCTHLSGIPTMFAMIMRQRDLLGELDFGSVEQISIGSAPLSPPLIDQIMQVFPKAQLRNGYGTTEIGPTIFGDHPTLERPPLSLGTPIAGVDVRLSGGTDEGVLQVRSPALLTGYVNRQADYDKRVRDGWYDTGDIMRRDGNDFYYFVGRSDDMFVCGGENVYPHEVEKLLERHPAVHQAVVVNIEDEIKGQIPVAFVILRDQAVDLDELKAFTIAHGPAYSHPRLIIPVGEFPVASTHKIDRQALKLQAVDAARSLRR